MFKFFFTFIVGIFSLSLFYYIFFVNNIEANKKVDGFYSTETESNSLKKINVSSEKNSKKTTFPPQNDEPSKLNLVTDISMLTDPLLSIDLATTSIMDIYQDLKAKADLGDLDSKYTLGMLLLRCIRTPRNEEELNDKINEYYQKSSHGYGLEQSLRDNYRICEGVSNEMSLSNMTYIDSAANQGHILSMNAYSILPIPNTKNMNSNELNEAIREYKEKRDNYLEKSLEKGSIYAAIAIGVDYYAGDQKEKDKIKAYAYLKLAQTYQPFKTSQMTINNIDADMTAYDRHDAEVLYNNLLQDFGMKEGVKLYSN
jgi:hypothetical protein